MRKVASEGAGGWRPNQPLLAIAEAKHEVRKVASKKAGGWRPIQTLLAISEAKDVVRKVVLCSQVRKQVAGDQSNSVAVEALVLVE